MFCILYVEENTRYISLLCIWQQLVKKRIHVRNPSAKFLGKGKLENHMLDFIGMAEGWGGCCATIVPTDGAIVWGAVWRVGCEDSPPLDRQEGVHEKIYFSKIVDVIVSVKKTVKCRTYQQTINPAPRRETDPLPESQWPSLTYMDVIIRGAVECQLPEEYIAKLKKIPNNGKLATLRQRG